MSSEIKADKWSPASGTAGTIGDSGDTFTVPSGVTLNTSSATLSIPSTVITSQTEKSSLVDADKFLVSDSAASGALKYVQKSNLGAGGLVLIEQEKSSGSSAVSDVQFANVFTSTYQMYRLIGFASSYDNDVSLRLRYMDGTTADSSTEYRHLRMGEKINSSNTISSHSSGNTGESFSVIADGLRQDNQYAPVMMDLTFIDPAKSYAGYGGMVGNVGWNDHDGDWHTATVGHTFRDASATVNGFNIYCSSGNTRYYDLKLYGVVNA